MWRIALLSFALLEVFPFPAHAQFNCPAHQFVNGAGFGGTTRCKQPSAGDIVGGTLSGNTFFGGGSPWVDVKSGANGCAAAVGNAVTDDKSAIQCQINYMNSNFGGGVVFFPPGNYHVASSVTVKGGIQLVGVGWNASGIFAGADITVLAFDGTCTSCHLSGMAIGGFQNNSATNDLVTVAANALVDLDDAYLSGGRWAVNTAGVDGHWKNVQIFGWGSTGGGILSTGSNWYEHAKIDQIAVATAAAYKGGARTALGGFEDHFLNSDFSCNSGPCTNSVVIADTNNIAITTFMGCVFSNAISITGGSYTIFVGNEFGASATVTSSVNESVVGSFGQASLTFTGAGTRSCAGNSNISC